MYVGNNWLIIPIDSFFSETTSQIGSGEFLWSLIVWKETNLKNLETFGHDSNIFKPPYICLEAVWWSSRSRMVRQAGPGFRCAWCAIAIGLTGTTGRCLGEFRAAQECLLFAINAPGGLVEVWRGFVPDPRNLGSETSVFLCFFPEVGALTDIFDSKYVWRNAIWTYNDN